MAKSGGMHMFIGEFHHNIDDKGRLTIPSKYRDILGKKFIITRGIEKCLYVYTLESWNNIVNKLETLPFTKKDARNFIRFFLSGACEAELDKQGRINITSPLVDYANLKKECIVVGTGDRLEIWSLDLWNDFLSSVLDSMSDIADDLFREC